MQSSHNGSEFFVHHESGTTHRGKPPEVDHEGHVEARVAEGGAYDGQLYYVDHKDKVLFAPPVLHQPPAFPALPT